MSGRLENENKIDQRTRKKLETLPPYVSEWFLNFKASRNTASSGNDYVNKIGRFLSSINSSPDKVTFDQITEEAVTKYFLSCQTKIIDGETKYTSDSYQQGVWNCLNNFLGFLEKRGYIKQNYIQLIDKPSNRDLDRINEGRVRLTELDYKKILQTVANSKRGKIQITRDTAILRTYMETGMRKTALINIELDDIDWDKRQLTVIDKGYIKHTYSLGEELFEAIQKWIKIRPLCENPNKKNKRLFLTLKGNAISDKEIYYLVRNYGEKALGKKISPHKFRGGFCSILYEKTGNLEFVRRAVGHARVDTTSRYISTDNKEKEQASKILESLF